MGQKRLIDADVLASPDLAGLSPSGKLLWIGMILSADDEGRLCAEPEWLIRRVFGSSRGIRRQFIADCLAHFEARGMIELYEFTRSKVMQSGECGTSVGLVSHASGTSVGGESHASGTSVGLVSRNSRDSVARQSGQCGTVTYCRLTNFLRYQKLRKPKPSTRCPGMEGKGIEENPPLPPRDRGGGKDGGGDEDAWRRFEELAGQNEVANPSALTAKLKAKYAHPREAGYGWWTEPEQAAADDERQALVKILAKVENRFPNGDRVFGGFFMKAPANGKSGSAIPLASLDLATLQGLNEQVEMFGEPRSP